MSIKNEYDLLVYMVEKNNFSEKEIAEETNLPESVISSFFKRLMYQGLVAPEYEITPKGTAACDQAIAILRDAGDIFSAERDYRIAEQSAYLYSKGFSFGGDLPLSISQIGAFLALNMIHEDEKSV